MKLVNMYTSVALALCTFTSWAGESIDKSLPLNSVNKVNIENLRGEVLIIGGDGDEVTVKGELDDKAEGFVFEQEGSQILIKVIMPRHIGHGSWNEKGSDLKITIPSHVKVDFDSVSSNVDVSNFSKGVEIKTVSGDIKAENLSEYINLSSVSGNIQSDNLAGKVGLSVVSGDIEDKSSSGRLSIKSVSGDITTESNAHEISLSVVSGEIEFTSKSVQELDISTISGNFEGDVNLIDNGYIKMSSVNGDLDLKLNEDIQASFKINSNAGGRLLNKLTNDKAHKAKYGPSSKLYFTTGNANSSVKASTVSGRVTLSSN
jgi:DUF4097 and DUF4098 domain-containing protein YvlB